MIDLKSKYKHVKQLLILHVFIYCIIFILDSDFQHLAQMSQAHTLVGLARSPNANPKFFLPPRNISWTKEV